MAQKARVKSATAYDHCQCSSKQTQTTNTESVEAGIQECLRKMTTKFWKAFILLGSVIPQITFYYTIHFMKYFIEEHYRDI